LAKQSAGEGKYSVELLRQVKVNIQLNSYEEVPKPLEGVVFELFAEKPTTLSTPLAKGITLEDG